MTHEIVAVLFGFLAGTLSALFGVGGGLIFVPTLIFLGENAHVAVATSLAAMVPVILMGSWRQTRYGNVNWRDAIVIGLASVPRPSWVRWWPTRSPAKRCSGRSRCS